MQKLEGEIAEREAESANVGERIEFA